MKITPALVACTWDFLRGVFPFLRAPPADDVAIVCNKRQDVLGEWRVDYPTGKPARYRLTITTCATSALAELIRLVAHEMVHAHQTVTNTDTISEHNAEFYRIWRRCAQAAGWDTKRIT